MMLVYAACILLAFIFPCIGIFVKTKKPFVYTVISLLLLNIGYLAHARLEHDWVIAKDVAALLDTTGIASRLSLICFLVICIVNVVLLKCANIKKQRV